MSWALAVLLIVLVLVAVFSIVLVVRNNQLSLARDVCYEALRQVNVQREQRHALVPEFVSLARSCQGNAEVEAATRELSGALAQAFSAGTDDLGYRSVAAVGPVEDEITAAIDAVADLTRVRKELTDADATCVVQLHDLYEHLLMVEHRLSAAVRYYNLMVFQYSLMREAWVSRPLRGVYREFAHIAYTPNEYPDHTPNTLRIDERESGTDYRPGSVFG